MGQHPLYITNDTSALIASINNILDNGPEAEPVEEDAETGNLVWRSGDPGLTLPGYSVRMSVDVRGEIEQVSLLFTPPHDKRQDKLINLLRDNSVRISSHNFTLDPNHPNFEPY